MSDARGTSRQAARERPEPIDGQEPVPLFVWATGIGVALFGFVYYILYTGSIRADDGDGRTSQVIMPPGPPNGAEIYARLCSACHQPTGLGVPGTYPPLAGSNWLLRDAATPVRIVLLGIQGPLQVGGHTYDGLMPAWRGAFSDEQVAAVLSYARSHFGNDAPPIDAVTVGSLRAQYASRTSPWAGGAELDSAAAEAEPPVPRAAP